jgi:hypothetical protein
MTPLYQPLALKLIEADKIASELKADGFWRYEVRYIYLAENQEDLIEVVNEMKRRAWEKNSGPAPGSVAYSVLDYARLRFRQFTEGSVKEDLDNS